MTLHLIRNKEPNSLNVLCVLHDLTSSSLSGIIHIMISISVTWLKSEFFVIFLETVICYLLACSCMFCLGCFSPVWLDPCIFSVRPTLDTLFNSVTHLSGLLIHLLLFFSVTDHLLTYCTIFYCAV